MKKILFLLFTILSYTFCFPVTVTLEKQTIYGLPVDAKPIMDVQLKVNEQIVQNFKSILDEPIKIEIKPEQRLEMNIRFGIQKNRKKIFFWPNKIWIVQPISNTTYSFNVTITNINWNSNYKKRRLQGTIYYIQN
ncbi:hypothetical protein GF322_03040 [Candidatus Dependentiae bacterium]|nr:hypothetical protein [Candidatus Dependentiae bacterium]